jgi:hypothetical protein
MMVVRVETLDSRFPDIPDENRVLTNRVIVAETVGDALNAHAPDPREGATFRVTLLHKDADDAR